MLVIKHIAVQALFRYFNKLIKHFSLQAKKQVERSVWKASLY